MPNKVNSKINTNFSNVIKNLSPNSQKDLPWYKRKVSIIGMSSTLGVGVLATAIAVPIVLTSNITTGTTPEIPKIPITPQEFNAKPLIEKIDAYNKLINDNNMRINDYLFKQKGMYEFVRTNSELANVINQTLYEEFIAYLNSEAFKLGNVVYSINKENYLKIIDKVLVSGSNQDSNLIYASIFPNNTQYLFFHSYAIVKSIVNNIEIGFNSNSSTYSLSIFCDTTNANARTMFYVQPSSAVPIEVLYRNNIVMNDSTLFSGMSEYIKTTILNIK